MTRKPSAHGRTGLVYDPLYREHDPGEGHPESPARCDAVLRGIELAVPPDALLRIRPRRATEADVMFCHPESYIKAVQVDVADGIGCLRTGDTDVSAKSFEVALWAVGGVLEAVDAVMAGKVRNAFCAVRPPGHHATAEQGMGFCIFNNVALGARYAQARHGIQRILIVDWDIHHGNGTQAIFYDDPSVFYLSTHQWPFYPGTGTVRQTGQGEGKGTTVNCPFPAGSGRAEVVGAFREKLLPPMRKFRPEFVFVSAGFDGRRGDPIGNFELADDDFSELTEIVMQVAAEYANGRLVSVLEGGYSLSGLASSAGAHVLRLTQPVGIRLA